MYVYINVCVCVYIYIYSIIGDRFPWRVKSAILSALHSLIKKCNKNLKAVVPQLQTTLLRSLSDSQMEVRERAREGLFALLPLLSRGIYIYIYIYIWGCVWVCRYIYVYIYICVCVCVCISNELNLDVSWRLEGIEVKGQVLDFEEIWREKERERERERRERERERECVCVCVVCPVSYS